MNRMFKPVPEVIVPLLKDYSSDNALKMAANLSGKISLLGLVEVPFDKSLSGGNIEARAMRKLINRTGSQFGFDGTHHVSVSHNLWLDLVEYVETEKPEMLVIEWPYFFRATGITYEKILWELNCNVAFIVGPCLKKFKNVFLPMRGGPHAQSALRFSLALPHVQLSVLHLTGKDGLISPDDPFRGLDNILTKLSEVNYEQQYSENPIDTISKKAEFSDLLILGATEQPVHQPESLGDFADKFIAAKDRCVVVVKAPVKAPTKFTGPEGERTGYRAISILVDKWFAERTFHANEFNDVSRLIELKKAQNLTISLALPALNEEETVGNVIQTIRAALMEKHQLLDEIVLIDSNSSDRTREITEALGVPVHIHQQLLPQYGIRAGKGEALWKSLAVTRGDLLVWIDSDIVNIHPRFVLGILGPLLVDPNIQFVKGFYQRPLRTGRRVQSTGGGRVTELTARPLLNLFYPELSGVIQPLSGEYGGRRKVLEQLTFFSGYGVETGLLIDVYEKFGLSAIAQTDLLERVHHNQSLEALSKMSFVIIQTILRKLESRMNRPLLEEVNKSMKLIQYLDGAYYLDVQEIAERERPPMIEIPEYVMRFQ